MYHLRVQPSELEALPYYEFEWLVKDLKEIIDEKNKAEKGATADQQANTPDYSKYKSPTMPKMPSFKMPKM